MKIDEAKLQVRNNEIWDRLDEIENLAKRENRSFTDEEKQGFINRQLTETRQSTKAVLGLLKELYPDTEIVTVKAGLVSEFRQEFKLVKSRQVNDLHHAKDAYLNIAVGNVWHEKYTGNFFIQQPAQIAIPCFMHFTKLQKNI